MRASFLPRAIFIVVILCGTAIPLATATAHAAEASLRDEAAAALRRATDYFDAHVSCEGGYLWRYSLDLERRMGEQDATATQVWVQDPGTPGMGRLFMDAHVRTGEPRYVELAGRACRALVRGQLRSGGWDYRIEFDPALRPKYAYRVDPPAAADAFNRSTLDDDTTQSALRLLIAYDVATGRQDREIGDAIRHGLEQLIAVQHPGGGWSQRFTGPPAEPTPARAAGYPETWSREFEGKDWYGHCTFNDGAIGDVIRLFLLAWRTYDDPRYLAAAKRGGEFILLAQMPEPQPAWAQQYDAEMHPAWARAFEPPSVTGGESQGVLRTLLELYRQTGERRFLEPIPRALAWMERSELPEGGLARFYELKTNRPLFFKGTWPGRLELVYADDDRPLRLEGYGYVVESARERLEREYAALASAEWQPPAADPPRPAPRSVTEAEVRQVIAALDEQGRWVTMATCRKGGNPERALTVAVFIRNARILADFIAVSDGAHPKKPQAEAGGLRDDAQRAVTPPPSP
jgi:PelA/Pel-15E family pectate lyase